MRSEFRSKIAGRTWRIVYEDAKTMGKDWGRCWLPAGRHPLIQLRRALRGYRAMDVLVHEVLHAARPELDEQAVEATATAIARALWKAGYRRMDQ
ncbi:MAG: hypothetical protein LW625_02680 [Planctomycetaceae bacterium]|nr:hypothetical protein [Planctomycetaceae bacterium]